MKYSFLVFLMIFAVGLCPVAAGAQDATATSPAAKTSNTSVLSAVEAAAKLPASVFFRGQSASIQARNSGGVHFADDMFVLAALVDTSGYSSSVQQKYQAYLITEVPLLINDHTLPPGAYGVGMIANDQFIAMDLGAHDLFTTRSDTDAALRRPRPLQVVENSPNDYRLYLGRRYVSLSRGK